MRAAKRSTPMSSIPGLASAAARSSAVLYPQSTRKSRHWPRVSGALITWGAGEGWEVGGWGSLGLSVCHSEHAV
jgi:hypothetical protein